jgi:hypothetical protein
MKNEKIHKILTKKKSRVLHPERSASIYSKTITISPPILKFYNFKYKSLSNNTQHTTQKTNHLF